MNEAEEFMVYRTRTILLAVCLTVLSVAPRLFAQEKPLILRPNQSVTFSFAPGDKKSFALQMKEDGFAEITWLANDSLILAFAVLDSSKRKLETGDSTEHDSALFIAPKDGEYTFVIKFDKSSELTEPQSVSLEYRNIFKLQTGTKQKDIRRINGYDVRIMLTPPSKAEGSESLVLIQKNGILKKVMKSYGQETLAGFFFGDDMTRAFSAQDRRGKALVKSTSDITGDGIPDVMIDYYSGGAHCCFVTDFINLGEHVEMIETIGTGHAGIIAVRKDPNGGLVFGTADNAFAYWLTSFAESPFPDVMLVFDKGTMKPNFELMKKPAPSLATLKTKARAARLKINNEPYTETEGGDLFPFWGEMLDLIYTGNETLAWQYFDLVWPAEKAGKALFLRDFKKQLSESYYGTRDISRSRSF